MPCFRSVIRSLTSAMFLVCLSLVMTGCLFTQDTVGERCDEGRRCHPGDAPVCGIDGITYTCASYAGCLGVQIDESREACNRGISECPDLVCGEIACEFGRELDPDGCETCACKPAPTCEPLGCRLYCEDGYKKDADGCDLCECAGGQACEPVACTLACEYGFKTDADGCATCECEEPPVCPAIACEEEPGFLACEEYLVDENGCTTCDCAKPVCPDYVCPPIECEYGYKTDEYGCTTCECEEPPSSCEPVLCNLACEYGFKRGENGCEVCECEEPPVCDGAVCDVYCPYGNVIGEDGCETCECNPAPGCNKDEDCPLDNVCDFDARPDCCMPDRPCTDDLPVCPLTCQQRQSCGFGAAACPQGTSCAFLDRADCCGPNEDCDADIPECPALCL